MASMVASCSGLAINRRPAIGASPPRLCSRRQPSRAARPVILGSSALETVQTASLLSDVGRTLGSVPVKDIFAFLLDHPVASLASAAVAVFVVPKLVEAFVRYLAAPVAIALLAFYALEFPEGAASFVTTVLNVVNAQPELVSLVVIGLAIFGLVPALATAVGATALIYVLLSISFGTQLPEVEEMQGRFGEVSTRAVSSVTMFSSVAGNAAGKAVEQLLK